MLEDGTCHVEAAIAVLTGLGLSRDEIVALARQGFVCRERRVPGPPVHKLRFRVGLFQRVIFLGRDPERARRVREALRRWQQPRRAQREIARLAREAAALLRETKRQLDPHLAGRGLHFHGQAIRVTLPTAAAVPERYRD